MGVRGLLGTREKRSYGGVLLSSRAGFISVRVVVVVSISLEPLKILERRVPLAKGLGRPVLSP